MMSVADDITLSAPAYELGPLNSCNLNSRSQKGTKKTLIKTAPEKERESASCAILCPSVDQLGKS